MHDKVLLLELKERTSANGNRYMSGWLGKASVVAFLDKDAEEPTWQVYVSTPKSRQDQEGQRAQGRSGPSGRVNSSNQSWRQDVAPRSSSRSRDKRPLAPGELDDSVSDLGGRRG